MNPNEYEHPARRTPAPEEARPDPVEATGAPDAIQAADVDRKPNAEAVDPAKRKARGVDWLRSSDLLARGSGVISRLAIDFDAHLAHKAHDPLARGVKDVASRARELPPISAFGRGTSHDSAGRGPVGMS
ncbi:MULTISPECIES: hypothetical protein [unclassified Brevibacterium]|uniref:hypothetical protein n=1 Tax=unclassified Brevibacterium TaxID=2614124 RepID=UPI0010817319|nr:hypothetical protein [Brevibacterium sp. S111]TGD10617.1 hypothetical protein EB836_10465 [Brevibacterium sp. S111]